MIAALLACTPPAPPAPDVGVSVWSDGEDRGDGNLLGLQPWVTPASYRSPEAFDAVWRPLLEGARSAGLLGPQTVVVLPEYAGVWLVALDQSDAVIDADTADDALTLAVLSDPAAWADASADAPADDATTYGVFAMHAERAAQVYQDVLGGLAAEFGVTLVGGSVLLPEPAVVDGRIAVAAHGPLRNASFAFGPDGALLGPPTVKAFPTADELPFVTPGDPADLPVYDTPAGRLGVLVCADSWFPDAYAALAGRVDLVAVPVFGAGDASWSAPWKGYSGWSAPEDVDPGDIGALTEGEAWSAYSLPTRLPESGASAGIAVPLRGELWDLGSDGHGFAVRPGASASAPTADEPLLVNVWL
jgi:predicted amidohydrolase